jgi:multicomponent Na+:H+ antiporter subunit B
MRSLILRTAARYLLPLLLLFSVFVLLRGHNEPGGGFIAGLVASAAFALYGIAYGVDRARQVIRVSNRDLIGFGLLIAVSSALFPLLLNDPFMYGEWMHDPLPAIGKIGTPFGFDLGVFFVVIGVVLTIVFTLAEEQEEFEE